MPKIIRTTLRISAKSASRYFVGANRVTVGRAQAGSQAQVQLAASYYVLGLGETGFA